MTSTMWSLNHSSNQEDDGLEPIHGSALSRPSSSPAHPSRSSYPAPPRGSSVAPQSGVMPTGGKRNQEPTLILRERQVDSVRAEVMRHRRAVRVKRYMGTAAWVLAGGLAVLLGAFLARGARTFFEPSIEAPPAIPPVAPSGLAPAALPTPAPGTPVASSPLASTPLASTPAPTAQRAAKAPSAPTRVSPAALPKSEPARPREPHSAPRRNSLRLDEIPTE
jgi:hypothetical protein